MNINLLNTAVAEIKHDLETAITTGQIQRKSYDNGHRAKEALIRSQRLIMKIHEVTKASMSESLTRQRIPHIIHPPMGQSSPELSVTGFIKAKKQDLVFIMNGAQLAPERLSDGPLAGEMDKMGREATGKSIVIGVRSQLSSVAKNFDTLMERAFAETLNLRLRLPKLVMAEVYMLPIVEYDDVPMVRNTIGFKRGFVPVEKFIRTFLGISGRDNQNLDGSLYKYDRSCLILIDCRNQVPTIFTTLDSLKEQNVVSPTFQADFNKLSPVNFCDDLISAYMERHPADPD
ncbi:MAG: hypothetical protein EHM48_04770 [Planctomycetaceae bacterium]|nr:MAG: hypothetical protein EHM48_04770 [Planctomycetaceae bacterium]